MITPYRGPNLTILESELDITRPSETSGRVLAMFVLVVLTLSALAGNGILCYLVHTKYHLRTIPNRLVLSLSWCGALTTLYNGPLMMLTTAKQDWVLGRLAASAFRSEVERFRGDDDLVRNVTDHTFAPPFLSLWNNGTLGLGRPTLALSCHMFSHNQSWCV